MYRKVSQRRLIGLVVCLWWAISAVLAAQQPVPDLTGRVVDRAALFGELQAEIEGRLRRLEDEGRGQMVVLTVDSLAGEPIEDFSIRVAEAWQLGSADADDGLLLVIAKSDRRMRLEVGYGLEDQIPDAVARRVLDRVLTPAFAAGDYAGGVLAAVDAVEDLVAGRPVTALESIEEPSAGTYLAFALVIGGFIFWIWLYRRQKRRGGRDAWTSSGGWQQSWNVSGGRRKRRRSLGSRGRSGGFSGGFSGGGGSFGGGGASGSW